MTNKINSYEWMMNFVKWMLIGSAFLVSLIIPSVMHDGILSQLISVILVSCMITSFGLGMYCAIKGVITND